MAQPKNARLSWALEMAHYFVTMDLEPDAYPQLPTDGLAKIVREAILPSVEALVPLGAARKLVTGGYLLGERQLVFVFEADSEEEVRKMLDDLPLSGVAKKADIKRMQALGTKRRPRPMRWEGGAASDRDRARCRG